MQENEKSKKKTIEKLRMILDNPYSEDLHIENEKNLDTLRERLAKSNNGNFSYIHETFVSEDDSLKASVTIHKKEKDNLVVPEFKQVEPEVEKQKEDPFKDEALYEVEKVEAYLPEFTEVKPEESAKEEKTPAEEKPESVEGKKADVIKSPKSINEELPEWEPVDAGETKIAEVKEEREKELSEWEPISGEEPEWEKKEPEVAEKIKEEIPVTKKENKIDVFKDIESIDEKTAILLYNNNFASIDDLRRASIKDLTNIKGIKRKLAKQIKKDIEKEIDKSVPIISREESTSGEYIFLDEEVEEKKIKKIDKVAIPKYKSVKEEKSEQKMETQEWESTSSKEPEREKKEQQVAEKIKEEIPVTKKENKIDVFKDIESIDEKTAKLLYKNKIISVDILRETPINELTRIKGIRRKLAKKIKKEVGEAPKRIDREDEWHVVDAPKSDIKEKREVKPSFHKDEVPEQKQKETKTYRYGAYALYRKEITVGPGKKRTIHFFSRTEPEDGGPVDLPEGYEVKVNKKTGVPYIRKKK
jgi:Helix-hairpin-helix domain